MTFILCYTGEIMNTSRTQHHFDQVVVSLVRLAGRLLLTFTLGFWNIVSLEVARASSHYTLKGRADHKNIVALWIFCGGRAINRSQREKIYHHQQQHSSTSAEQKHAVQCASLRACVCVCACECECAPARTNISKHVFCI